MVHGLVLTFLVYVGACLLVPLVWGLVVHWLFSRLGESRSRPRPTTPADDSRPTRWDYHI